MEFDIKDNYIYISAYKLDTKYWEHLPKCLSPFGKCMNFDMDNVYFSNTLRKKLYKIHQWHMARPLHEKYKECKNTTY